jgi:hypothetical protein
MVDAGTRRVLMIGDVVGSSGMEALKERLPGLIKDLKADIVIANGENATEGFGLNAESADKIMAAGVDVITGGNHIWEKKDANLLLDSRAALLRPANYPDVAPGHGTIVLEKGGVRWLVMNLQGREGMTPIDCPFRKASALLDSEPDAVAIIDFHAESSEEKEALSLYLDGRVAVFAGTHTHVQTADDRILPQGSGYITDLGMSGPIDSVIGVKHEICIRRSLSQMPIKMEVADGKSQIQAALFEIDCERRVCVSIRRIVS